MAASENRKNIRFLLAKPGLDGHDRGVKVIAKALLEAGIEVIYTGLFQSPTQVISAAIQEDVDAIGLSILDGTHLALTEEILRLAQDNGIIHIPIFLGGVVSQKDAAKLKQLGVAEIFGPGTSTRQIIQTILMTISQGSER
jgi:methylmalonyl-CoA mutase, C-terminal domain